MKKVFTRILLHTCNFFLPISILFLCVGVQQTAHGQATVIIDSVTNNGGFESGATGWTITNGSQPNKWRVGTTATAGFSQTQAAFISQSATTPYAHTYDIDNGSIVHFYQDVNLPAAQPNATLSFRIICEGEGTTTLYDYLTVYLAPTSVTPTAGVDLGTTYQVGTTYNLLGPNWIQVNISIPPSLTGNVTAASARRLIFQWQNDFSVGDQPPAGIDNIKLVTHCGVATQPATAIAATTATFNWDAFPGATAYQVRYKKTSDPATVATWTTPVTVALPATSYNATGLAPNQVEYEYQVLAVGACSEWSFSEKFLTDCAPLTPRYTETFEGIQNDDEFPACMTITNPANSVFSSTVPLPFFNQDNHTPGGSKYAYFSFINSPDAIITPPLTLTGGSTYKFSYWYITDGYSGWTSLNAYFGSSPSISGLTGLIGTISNPLNTAYQQFTGTFTVPATGTYYVGIVCSNDGNPVYLTVDDLDLIELPPCAGRPVAGTIVPVSVCPNQTFQLDLAGGTSGATTGGITYQWQDSTILGWQNSVGPTAVQATYVDNITTPRRYRAIVTCNNSGMADTSAPFTVQIKSFIDCYCAPDYLDAGADDNITSFTLKNLTNNTASTPNNPPGYNDYTSQQPAPLPIPTLVMGQTDTVKITMGADGNQYSSLWIDFNHSGSFDNNEYFSLGTNAGASGVAAIPFTTPLNAEPGLTRLRVRGGDDQALNGFVPCGASGSDYGEAEDYLVDIIYPPCNGPVVAGAAIASDTAMCAGYTINLTDTTHEKKRSQLSWSWENSMDGGLSWNPVANSANKDTLNNVLFTGAVSYRLKMVCDATGDSSYSTVASINLKPPYDCYCYSQSAGGSGDSSDIGAVAIGTMTNTTGGPHILNPVAVRRRTDYTYIPNITMEADETYLLSIYQTQRNGIHADARVSVFIDYNNDLVYDANAQPNSELVYSAVTDLANFYLSTQIRIPNAVVPDVPTGLRVILNNDLDPQSPANQGCGPYESGETEDYVVMFRRIPQGVGNVSNIREIALYPNPTNGRFTVSANASRPMDQVALSVMSITGQTLLKKAYGSVGNKFVEELDLSETAKGIYFVELKTSAGEKVVRKLIIK